MKTAVHRTAKTGIPLVARAARRRPGVALQVLRLEAPDIFSDREEDAVEYENIVRDFAIVRDEALSGERYN